MQLNTYFMGLRSLYILYSFSAWTDFRRQILMSIKLVTALEGLKIPRMPGFNEAFDFRARTPCYATSNFKSTWGVNVYLKMS